MKRYLILAAVAYAVAWVVLFAVCHFIYERDPELAMHLWGAGQYWLCKPWLIFGQAIAAFFAMFSGTPGMIDGQAIESVAVFTLAVLFLFVGIPWMWRGLKKVWGGSAKAAH